MMALRGVEKFIVGGWWWWSESDYSVLSPSLSETCTGLGMGPGWDRDGTGMGQGRDRDGTKDRRSRMRHLNPKDIRLLSASPAYEELSAPFYPSNQITISFSGTKCARIMFCRCAFIQTQITKREMEQTKLQFQIQMNR